MREKRHALEVDRGAATSKPQVAGRVDGAMRRLAFAVLMFSALLPVGTAVGNTRCPRAPGEQIQAFNPAVLVTRRAPSDLDRWYVCDRHTGQKRRFFEGFDYYLFRVVVAGRFVAWDEGGCDRYGAVCPYGVVVLDTVTGRRRYTDLKTNPVAYDLFRDPLAGPLVLRASGVGAIATATSDGVAAITRFGVAGRSHVVIRAPDLDYRSLQLHAGTIYWTQAGQVRAQPLR